jgi:hypothetical protein
MQLSPTAGLGGGYHSIQPLQQYSSFETSSQCDPTQYFPISSTPQIHIVSIELNKQIFRPGETLSFTVTVQVSYLVVYANCYGQSYNSPNQVSPSQANVQVAILGKTLQFTPSSSGAFSGSTTLLLSQGGGSYTATATGNFQGATDTKNAMFSVETYAPTLSVTYPSLEIQAHPGESILLKGDGWIPNMQVLILVDDNFNVSTDSSGHFTLQIPIPLTNPPAEGNHTVTVEQANLMQSTTFIVQYRTLLLSLSGLNPVTQGQNVTLSGNVTALETHQAVPDANVTLVLMGHSFTVQTDANGTFRTRFSIDVFAKPGMYTLYRNATRGGFRASALATEAIKVLPASNVPLVASVIVAGSAAGVATSLTLRKVSKPKVGPSSIGPGSGSTQPSIGPGSQQVQPKIGAGQHPSVGPGSAAKGHADLGEVRTGPVPPIRASEFCIHCGLEIRRGLSFCSKCGLRLK